MNRQGAQDVIQPAATNHCMNPGHHREQVYPSCMPAVNDSTSTCGERKSAKQHLLSSRCSGWDVYAENTDFMFLDRNSEHNHWAGKLN